MTSSPSARRTSQRAHAQHSLSTETRSRSSRSAAGSSRNRISTPPGGVPCPVIRTPSILSSLDRDRGLASVPAKTRFKSRAQKQLPLNVVHLGDVAPPGLRYSVRKGTGNHWSEYVTARRQDRLDHW